MERTNTLFGRRIMLRPLVLSDFAAWREVRHRCGEWLTKWEPQRLPNQPDTTQDRDAFAVRCSASTITRRFSSRWWSSRMWPNSAPPARCPGSLSMEAAAQTCSLRSGAGASTSTVSPRQNRSCVRSAIRARTRSPGSVSGTKTTLPSWRATKTPPCATLVMSRSTSSFWGIPRASHR